MPDAPNIQPAAAPVETLKVKVDGREVEAPRFMPDPLSGKPVPTTMIQACEIAGVTVPHYCYHPKLPVFFVLEFTADQTAPVWRVVWGETIGTSQYSILVNGATGEFVKALR